MRIAILGSRGYPFVYSGYETFVQELAPRLVKKGHHVTVYCHRGLFSTRPSVVNGIELCYIPAVEHKVLSQFTHSLLSTLHALFCQYDVILYVNSANGPFGILTKLFGKKTAINVDGLEWLRPKWKGLGAKYFHLASRLATKFFDVIITDSDEMAKIYKEEFDSPSITIAYGANIAYSNKPELISQYELNANDYYLVVGRLIPDNNADLVVRAFEMSGTNRRLVILGDVPYKDKYAESVRTTKDPRIIFPGYIRDADTLRELYCNCYAYIHGHEFGGTNPALLKALAYGCCVYALDTRFNREVLAGERHGLYFSKTEDSFLEGLSVIERDEVTVTAKRQLSRDRIVQRYTWERIVEQYDTLLASVVDGSKRRL